MDGRSLSRLISLVLRHRPDEFGLLSDPEGWVPVDDLVAVLRTRRPEVTRADVEGVVAHNDPAKQRFSIVRTSGGLRTSWFHGTNGAVVDTILADGLQPMARQYVHLTPDLDIAGRVGARRGRPVVLRVDAAEYDLDRSAGPSSSPIPPGWSAAKYAFLPVTAENQIGALHVDLLTIARGEDRLAETVLDRADRYAVGLVTTTQHGQLRRQSNRDG